MAKIQYLETVRALMPEGKPNYLAMIQFPKITDLEQQMGRPSMVLMLSIMVRDFCASLNVVRNMNEDQIIEAAVMMLDDAGNFRLEDYAVCLQMAKRGDLIKIYDRIDLQVMNDLLDKYYEHRRDAKNHHEEHAIATLEGQPFIPRDPRDSADDRMASIGERFKSIGDLRKRPKKPE